MKFLFNFSLLSILTIIATSLIFVSINTVFANQFTQETNQVAPTKISSESTTSENSEDKPQPDGLHPKVAEKADILKGKAEEKDISIQITDGFRTMKSRTHFTHKAEPSPATL